MGKKRPFLSAAILYAAGTMVGEKVGQPPLLWAQAFVLCALLLGLGLAVSPRQNRYSPAPYTGTRSDGAVRRNGEVRRNGIARAIVAIAALGCVVAVGAWMAAREWHRLDQQTETVFRQGFAGWSATLVKWPEYRNGRLYAVVRTTSPVAGVLVQLGIDEAPDQSTGGASADADAIRLGDALYFVGRLQPPAQAGNPGQYDAHSFLARDGIAAVGYVPTLTITGGATSEVRLEGQKENGPFEERKEQLAEQRPKRSWLQAVQEGARAVRRTAVQQLNIRLSPDRAGLLAALALGDQSGLAESDTEDFRRTGLAHVLSVSGFHVGLIVALVLGVLKALRVPRMRNLWVLPVAIPLVWAYVVLTGASTPALRAGVMASIGLIAVAAGREREGLNALGAAALCILLWQPLEVGDLGFQLSFGATFGILCLTAPIQDRIKALWQRLPTWVAAATAISVAAQLMVTPILVAAFGQVSAVALIVNVPATLLVAGLMYGVCVALAIGWVPVVGTVLYAGLNWGVGLLQAAVSSVARLPWASIEVPAPPLWVVLGYYFCIWLLLRYADGGWDGMRDAWHRFRYRWVDPVRARLQRQDEKSAGQNGLLSMNTAKVFAETATPWTRRTRWIMAALLIGCIWVWWPVVAPWVRPLEIHFIDVGQGDAILIRTPNGRNVLVDGGGRPEYPGTPPALTFDVGDRIVVPYLKRLGIRRLDLAVNTHPHEDHVGGMVAVARSIPPTTVLDSGTCNDSPGFRAFWTEVEANGTMIRRAQAGGRIELGGGVWLEIIHPPASGPLPYMDLNDNSVVMRLGFRHFTALLTGDLDRQGQEHLLDPDRVEQALPKRVTLLKVAHHGSGSAYVPVFLDRLSPEIAVIQVGARNRYGHPSPAVIRDLIELGARVYRTDEHGAIVVRTRGRGARVSTHRPSSPSRAAGGSDRKAADKGFEGLGVNKVAVGMEWVSVEWEIAIDRWVQRP